MLRTVRLTKMFSGFRAVDAMNFEFQGGEIRCLIGPNGAGKSTLFNLITGILAPTSGEIWYRGANITHLPPHRRSQLGIGRKFQVPSVYRSMTVRENIQIPVQRALLKRMSPMGNPPREVKERIDEILLTVRLAEKGDYVASQLSHGEMQWLEIGMTLGTGPQLLLLDEPTAGMTAEETRETAHLIRRLAREIAVIVIEHDIHFIKEIADRITVMHNGSILTEGSIDEVEKDHRVRSIYLGEPGGASN